MDDVFHLGLRREQLGDATLAILPGDPDRVSKIAEQMDAPSPLAQRREFCSWRAEIAGRTVVVCSTGIGGPSTSIAVEELAQMGVRTFLRVGTTGAIQPGIGVGDVIITTGAVRLDGASRHFAPLSYPAVADFGCTRALVDAATERELAYHVGVTASSDTFYPGQERYDTATGFVRRSLRGSTEEYQHLGVLNFEMEGATLLTMCSASGWKAGMVAGVLVNRTDQEIPSPESHRVAQANAIAVVVDAAAKLTQSAGG